MSEVKEEKKEFFDHQINCPLCWANLEVYNKMNDVQVSRVFVFNVQYNEHTWLCEFCGHVAKMWKKASTKRTPEEIDTILNQIRNAL